MSITNINDSPSHEPAVPPGLEPSLLLPHAPPTPGVDQLSVDTSSASASTSSASSPILGDHDDSDPPRAPLKFISSLSIHDGCAAPHTVCVDDMDSELVREFIIDPAGRHVTTPSGPAAQQLKKRFNEAHGKDAQERTLYTITQFTNQYGKSMYRVEPRGMQAPAAAGIDITLGASSSAEVADRLGTQQKSPRGKVVRPRTSVMRMSLFNKGGQQAHTEHTAAAVPSVPGVTDAGRNRLRKSRSNSDFNGVPSIASGSSGYSRSPPPNCSAETLARRQHSHTVSGSSHGLPSPRLDGSMVVAANMTLAQIAAALPPPPSLDPLEEVLQPGKGSLSPPLTSPNGSLAPSLAASSTSFLAFGEDSSVSSGDASAKTNQNPFGPGISFNSPMTSSGEGSVPPPLESEDGENTPGGLLPLRGPLPSLRVMQSFESGMTARAGDHMRNGRSYGLGLIMRAESDIQPDILEDTEASSSVSKMADVVTEGALSPMDSAASSSDLVMSPSIQQLAAPGAAFLAFGDYDSLPPPPPARDDVPFPAETPVMSPEQAEETPRTHPKLQPAVLACLSEPANEPMLDTYDFIQRSRGLPRLDNILHSRDRALSISLESQITAQPKNDPRFIIWGDLSGPSKDIPSSLASSMSGAGPSAPTLAQSDSAQRLRSDSSATAVSQQTSISHVSHVSDGEHNKVMVAATIERWVAQLTSTMYYDELLVFFLTYRIYMTAREVAEVLICRFHWALGQGNVEQDEAVRKIVRVRTFVAFKYWITKFFTVDFVPHADVRQLMSRWLNALRRDPLLEVYTDAGRIVRKLIETIKDVRDEYERQHPSRVRRSNVDSTLVSEDGDGLDLEADFLIDADNLHENELPAFQSLVFKDGPTQRTVVMTLPSGPLPSGTHVLSTPDALTATFVTATPLPTNALSRALTNTIGRMRMARWKRALSTRPASAFPAMQVAKVSAFDLDLSLASAPPRTRSLPQDDRPALPPVTIKFQPTFTDSTRPSPVEPPAVPPKDASVLQPVAEDIEEDDKREAAVIIASDDNEEVPEPVVEPPEESAEPEQMDGDARADSPPPQPQPSSSSSLPSYRQPAQVNFDDAPSYRSSLASSRFSYHSQGSDVHYANPPGLSSTGFSSERPAKASDPSWRLNITNDLDFSDYSDSDDERQPARTTNLKRAKRMPRRGEFELVGRPDSMSSFSDTARSSVASSSSVGAPPDQPLEQITVEEWHLEAMADDMSDDEQAGDRDAALRRIEGQIDPKHERAKNHKAEGWVRQIREQTAAGITWHSSRSTDYDSDEEDYGEQQESTLLNAEPDESTLAESNDVDNSNELVVPLSDCDGDAATPLAEVPPSFTSISTLASTGSSSDHKPVLADVLPREILESRVDLPQPSPALVSASITSPSQRKTTLLSRMSYHKSFVLEYPSLMLAEHFAMIDRELFLAIKFEELTDGNVLRMSEEANVLDWSQFLKDRATARSKGQSYEIITMSLVAVRARFNLLASFVISEILLAPPNDRARVHSKFLRIAWKAQQINNFGTLVAVMHGLQSDWVRRAMHRHYQRLPPSDVRIQEALTSWVSSEGDFKFMKQQVESLKTHQAARPHASSISVTSDGLNPANAAPPVGCVPFIGIYLQQLRRYMDLPDLIDPTAPRDAPAQDEAGYYIPSHPEIFDALPPLSHNVQLTVLLNIQKQRLIANVVKSLVDGQHLAAHVQYAVDRKVYQRCLRLRALNVEGMQQALDQQGL